MLWCTWDWSCIHSKFGPLSVGIYWYKPVVERRKKRPVSSVSIGRGKMGLLNLFEVASMPILQVLIISMLGAFMATDYLKLLPPDARKYMNKVGCFFSNEESVFLYLVFSCFLVFESVWTMQIVFVAFTPSLVFASLAKTVNFQEIISWYDATMLLVSYEEKHAYLIICFDSLMKVVHAS